MQWCVLAPVFRVPVTHQWIQPDPKLGPWDLSTSTSSFGSTGCKWPGKHVVLPPPFLSLSILFYPSFCTRAERLPVLVCPRISLPQQKN